jgi:hypothetical protein
MKNFETKEYNHKREVCVRVMCDVCGLESKTGEWERGCYEVSETEVRVKTGSSYPEDGYGVEQTIDICPQCFRDKLIPWVESHGVSKIEEKEWDY